MMTFLRYLLAIALAVVDGFLWMAAMVTTGGVVLLPPISHPVVLIILACALFVVIGRVLPHRDPEMCGLVAVILGMLAGVHIAFSLLTGDTAIRQDFLALAATLVVCSIPMVFLELLEKYCERNRKGADCAKNGY